MTRVRQGQKELYSKHGIVGWGHYEWMKSKMRDCPHAKTLIARYAAVLNTEFGVKMPAVKWSSVLENCICNKEGRFKCLLDKKDFEFPLAKEKRKLTPEGEAKVAKAKRVRLEAAELERQIMELEAQKNGWTKGPDNVKAVAHIWLKRTTV